ncbi:MAG: VanZ family protein [Bacillota bacterium]
MKKILSPIVAWVPVVLWMMLIFFFSSQSATESAGISMKITQAFLGFINQVVPVFGSGTIDYSYLNHVVRKLAHFSLYMVLGILSARALRKSGMTGWKPLIAAVLICVLYAVTDELHQVFVPGRSGQISDVFIDSMGGLVGIFLVVPGMRK